MPKPTVALSLGAAVFVCLTMETARAHPDEFVMPVTADLYIQQMGGEAGGVTTFGLGTSPGSFVPYYSGLPDNPNPVGEVLVGPFSSGSIIHFGEFTQFGGQTNFAFSNGADQASIVAFTDVDNSLGMGGSIIQQTGAETWLLHLDDALSYQFDDDDNDVLMGVRVAPVPEPSTCLLLLSALIASLGGAYAKLRRADVETGRVAARPPAPAVPQTGRT